MSGSPPCRHTDLSLAFHPPLDSARISYYRVNVTPQTNPLLTRLLLFSSKSSREELTLLPVLFSWTLDLPFFPLLRAL